MKINGEACDRCRRIISTTMNEAKEALARVRVDFVAKTKHVLCSKCAGLHQDFLKGKPVEGV